MKAYGVRAARAMHHARANRAAAATNAPRIHNKGLKMTRDQREPEGGDRASIDHDLERKARQLAERVVRGSYLGHPDRYAEYAALCRQDGGAPVPMYGEADIRHYVETRWRDMAAMLERGLTA